MKPYLKYGLHMTLALFLIGFISGLISIGLITFLLYIGILVAGIYLTLRDTRAQEGGHLSFSRGFGLGMAAAMIPTVILSVLNYITLKFLAPDFLVKFRAEAIAEVERTAKTKAELDQAVSLINNMVSPGGLTILALIFLVFLSLVISLIMAGAMKKEDPHGGIDFPPKA